MAAQWKSSNFQYSKAVHNQNILYFRWNFSFSFNLSVLATIFDSKVKRALFVVYFCIQVFSRVNKKNLGYGNWKTPVKLSRNILYSKSEGHTLKDWNVQISRIRKIYPGCWIDTQGSLRLWQKRIIYVIWIIHWATSNKLLFQIKITVSIFYLHALSLSKSF